MAELPRLRVGLSLDSATFVAETRKVGAAVNQMGASVNQQMVALNKGFSTATAALKSFGIGFASIGSVSVLTTAARNTLAWADALKEASERIGIGVEQMQRLQRAGELTNVSQEQITNNLEKFARGLGDAARGTGTLKKALADTGIEIRNQDGSLRSVSDVFDEYVNAIATAGSEQEALSLAIAGFGRSGAGFVTTIREMQSSVNEFNVLTIEQIDNLAKYDDELAKFAQESNYYFKAGLSTLIDLQEARFKVIETIGSGVQSVIGGVIGAFDQLTAAALGADIPSMSRDTVESLADLELEVSRVGKTAATAGEDVDKFADAIRKANSAAGEGLGDVEFAAAGLDVAEARKEVEAHERALDQQAQAAKRAGDEATRLATNRRKALADLKTEAEQTKRLISALDQSESQYRAVEVAIEGENKARALGLDLASDDARAIIEGNRLLAESTDALARNREEMERRLDVFREMNEEELGRRMGQEEAGGMSAPGPGPGLEDVEAQASETQRIFENAADNIQDTFSDAFTNAFEGNLTSAQDFADQLKSIFTKTAGDIAAAMVIKPVLSGIGFGPQGGPGGPSGREWFGGAGSGATFTAPTRPTTGQMAGGAAFGATTGFTVGQTAFQGHTGATVGATIGGAAGGAAGSFLGPGGAMLGSVAGSAIGGFIGRQFGGGGQTDNRIRTGGGILGTAGLGGTGAGAQFAQGVDQSLIGLLTARQEALVSGALVAAKREHIRFDKQPSAADLSLLAAARIGPTAEALGFDPTKIAGTRGQFTGEQQLANLQTAIGLMRQMEGIRIGPVATQFRDLNDGFAEMRAEMDRLGISTAGLAEEQARANQALGRETQRQFVGVAAAVGAMSGLDVQLQLLNLDMQEAALRAQELGVPLHTITQQHLRLAAALVRQSQSEFFNLAERVGAITSLGNALQQLNLEMQEAAASAQQLGVPLGNIAQQHLRLAAALVRQSTSEFFNLAEQVGAISPLGNALQQLNLEMQEAAARAQELGVPLAAISQQHVLLAQALVRQTRAQEIAIGAQVGNISPLQAALEQLNIEMQEASAAALQLGVGTSNVTREHIRLAEALVREHEATIDALALSVTDPFERMLDPLRQFATSLTLGNLNPADQMEAAGDEFRRIAELARAGSTTAIDQLQGAGEAFISQMERFGASPGGAAARIEVQSVIESVMADISQAQREASAGLEDTIRLASQRQVDTLRELISETRVVAEEIKRLRR